MINNSTIARIAQLITKYLRNEISAKEKEELEKWINASPNNRSFIVERMKPERVMRELEQVGLIDTEAIWQKVQKLIQPHSVLRIRTIYAVTVAATIALVVVKIVITISTPKTPLAVHSPVEVNCPQIILDDGRVINLDSMNIGDGIVCNGWWMTKTSSYHIAYYPHTDLNGKSHKKHKEVNQLSLPHGMIWSISLPDGSNVQLNAGSSLSYDITPLGERSHGTKMLLEGEAFFDIRHDATAPCSISTSKGTIVVLGTRFDVRNYRADSALIVSLLTGSIVISNGLKKVELKPGQQANIKKRNDSIHVGVDADTALTRSWTFPYFDFTHKNIIQVMKQFEKWYGLESTVYRGSVDTLTPGLLGGGHVSRELSLMELVQTLQQDDLGFSLKGNKFIVSQITRAVLSRHQLIYNRE